MVESLDSSQQTLVARVQQIVSERMRDQQAGHGMDHVLRVLATARQIQAVVGGNRWVVELAAILHDIGDAKFHEGVEHSANFSREILVDLAAPADVIDHVVEIVDNISFRKRSSAIPLSHEGKIVQDADRLDALGAIGIVRTIEYGAARGQPFYVPGEPVENGHTGVAHFYQKLFKLRNLLNTEPAKQIALGREQFMREFLDQFFSEYNPTP